MRNLLAIRPSTDKNGRFVNVGPILDLRDKKVGDVPRDIIPFLHWAGSARILKRPVRGPLVKTPGRTIVQSSALFRIKRSCRLLS